ncbi:hypothetical protein ACLX1H_007963 [Fusarium chlamydosporum]
MSSTTTVTIPTQEESFTKLELVTAQGPVYRMVSSKSPRNARPDEVPIIDLHGIHGDLQARKELAQEIGNAAKNYGFFYIKNHGIPHETVNNAREAALQFFGQPAEEKAKVAESESKYSNGWSAARTRKVSPTESAGKLRPDPRTFSCFFVCSPFAYEPVDVKEGFIWSYDPANDPDSKDASAIPDSVKSALHCEDFIWEGTRHLPGFRDSIINYWKECVMLSRSLVRIFALALDLPEEVFDELVTYPGSDGAINYYPAMKPGSEGSDGQPQEVGLGSHTDLQCFTLLWQDQVGGLQVLSKSGQWLCVPPVEGTLVVNIGDYLMRLTNDRFVSNVHRVVGRAPIDRLSMPFFFGFNFNETVAVLPSCVDEDHPAKYEPISCGDVSDNPRISRNGT